ncbi:MAG: TolC family protein, partial [Waterburya sp.]
MKHTLKAIQTVAVSVPIILCSETSTQAENLPDLDSNPNSVRRRYPERNRLVETNSQTAPDLKHNPTSTQPATQISYAPKNLNPSTNLLKLPTQASEVKIAIEQPIGLQQAIDLAIKNNPSLQEARLNLDRSQKQLREAKAGFYPTLDSSVNVAENGSEAFFETEDVTEGISLPSAAGFADIDTSSTNFESSLTLSYNLYTGGLRGARIKQAEQQVSSSQLQLEAATLEIRFVAVRDYYNLQSADSQVKIEQTAVEEAQQTLQDALLLKQAGIGTKFDVIRAEVELANARQRLATVTAEQSTARRQLAATLSVGQQVELRTADTIEAAGVWQLSLKESIVAAYQNRAELEELLVQREINQQQKQIELAAIRPQIGLQASYDVTDQLDDDANLTDGYTVGVGVQWDLFDGGAAKARARQSETNIAINETQFANQRNTIRLEVEQGYFSLAANQGNINTSRQALELAEESLSLARVRFQSGEGTQTDVIQA